ncbi:MAG: SMC-Scp complex subunit ScpB [Thermotogota bacterium]
MDMKFQIVEALILSKNNGISLNEIIKRTNYEEDEIKKIINEIQLHYINEEHGIELGRFQNKFRFEIKTEIKKLITAKPKKMELTDTQFEVLTILFLNGASRGVEIEKSRGKNSYSQIKKLREYGLVKKVKRKNTQNSYLYDLSDKFYEWIPETTLKKLEEIKNANSTESTTDIGDEQKESS